MLFMEINNISAILRWLLKTELAGKEPSVSLNEKEVSPAQTTSGVKSLLNMSLSSLAKQEPIQATLSLLSKLKASLLQRIPDVDQDHHMRETILKNLESLENQIRIERSHPEFDDFIPILVALEDKFALIKIRIQREGKRKTEARRLGVVLHLTIPTRNLSDVLAEIRKGKSTEVTIWVEREWISVFKSELEELKSSLEQVEKGIKVFLKEKVQKINQRA